MPDNKNGDCPYSSGILGSLMKPFCSLYSRVKRNLKNAGYFGGRDGKDGAFDDSAVREATRQEEEDLMQKEKDLENKLAAAKAKKEHIMSEQQQQSSQKSQNTNEFRLVEALRNHQKQRRMMSSPLHSAAFASAEKEAQRINTLDASDHARIAVQYSSASDVTSTVTSMPSVNTPKVFAFLALVAAPAALVAIAVVRRRRLRRQETQLELSQI